MSKFTPSRGSRHKPAPLNLFTIAPKALEDELYDKFRAVAFDLMAKGLGMSGPHVTTCEDWWLSRFHDMLYPGSAAPKNHADWLYRHTAETNWKLIWQRIQTDILNGKRTSIR